MSNTPLNADELREAILLEFKNVHRLAPADYTENCTNIVMELITADRKKHELQAQLNYIEYLDQIPSNELMDWKGLLADSRKLIKQELEKL